jgi:hypothetical protein
MGWGGGKGLGTGLARSGTRTGKIGDPVDLQENIQWHTDG